MWWLLIAIGWLIVVSIAFVLGYLLAEHDAEQSRARIQSLQTERDMLSEQLAAQRDAQVKLERSHQIDVEAVRAAQAEILRLENDRMRLEQQATRLRALIGAGGRGVVDVQSLALARLDADRYDYRLTLSQLAPESGRTVGDVMLSIVAETRDGERVTTSVSELSAGSAGRHTMSFEHFQVFEGNFRLDDDLTPLDVIIEIVPKDDNLLPSQEVVRWDAAYTRQPVAPAPSGESLLETGR